MVYWSISNRCSIKIGQKVPDEDRNDHYNNETDGHHAPGMDFTLERPSSPVYSVKQGSPEPNHSKPKIKWAYWPSGVDESHKEQENECEDGPDDGHPKSRRESGFSRRPIPGWRCPWPVIA